jgi:hypothetical protein
VDRRQTDYVALAEDILAKKQQLMEKLEARDVAVEQVHVLYFD